jgi:hypothetical protein
MDAKRCANPAGCSHGFRRIDAGNVTAKPVGILTEGDAYEVIVPKGTSYPTFGPVVQNFRTAVDGNRAVLVPIFHAETGEFNPKDLNQWVGAADINLEGAHLPAGTKVDVCVSIDRDGCMDVEAIIQDGSGRRQRVFIDPKLGVNLGRMNGAEEKEKDGETAQEQRPEWMGRLQWSIVWAEIALREYEWLFPGGKTTTQTLQRLVGYAKEALEKKDETSGRRLENEIDQVLSGELKGAMILLQAEMRCITSNLEPATRSQIRSLVKEICDGLKTGAGPDFLKRKVEELEKLLMSITNVPQEEVRGSGDVILKK